VYLFSVLLFLCILSARVSSFTDDFVCRINVCISNFFLMSSFLIQSLKIILRNDVNVNMQFLYFVCTSVSI
jgi:low affinity Fe/Cu permease